MASSRCRNRRRGWKSCSGGTRSWSTTLGVPRCVDARRSRPHDHDPRRRIPGRRGTEPLGDAYRLPRRPDRLPRAPFRRAGVEIPVDPEGQSAQAAAGTFSRRESSAEADANKGHGWEADLSGRQMPLLSRRLRSAVLPRRELPSTTLSMSLINESIDSQAPRRVRFEVHRAGPSRASASCSA